MEVIIIFYFSLLLTVFFTPVFINYFSRHKITDFSEGRRTNSSTVPRIGGIVIYLITILSIIGFNSDLNEIRFFIIGSILLLLVGVFDDISEVTYQKKFAVQFLSAFFLMLFLSDVYSSINFFGLKIPSPFDKMLLYIFIVGVINSINLYDGLDGLVTGFSLLISFVTFFIGWQFSNHFLLILSASLIGSLIGFLKYNTFPAKIFLGDTGALTLGFFLVTSVLLSSVHPGTRNIDLAFSIILLAVPVIDTLRVMSVRVRNLKNPFLPDLSHIHHIILRTGFNYKGTLSILHAFSIIFVGIGLLYYTDYTTSSIILFILISAAVLYIKRIIIVFKKITRPSLAEKFSVKYPLLIPLISMIQGKDSK